MRIATLRDIPQLQALYSEAAQHGKRVGDIDWPEVFPVKVLTELISRQTLYCFEQGEQICAAVSLSSTDRPSDWPTSESNYYYIGKLATAHSVRGTNFVYKVVLPAIKDLAMRQSKRSLCLSCLGYNQGLINFYTQLGFMKVGNTTIVSKYFGHEIAIARFELQLLPK